MESNKKACSIIAFVTVMVTLLVAIIVDIAIFAKVIATFFIGIFVSVCAFIFLFILMIVSFIFIFGFYLAEQYGFWPLNLSFQFFKEILADIKIEPSQIATFRGWRIAFLIICVFALVMAIIALHKDEMINEKVPLKGMSVVALIFAILGILAGLSMIAITSMIG